ncbi:MAG: lipid A export permease/ATP-binding protein MsbA [Steroidobacteraceae bacterium]
MSPPPAAAALDAGAVYRRLLGYARPHWGMFMIGVLGMLMYASVSTITAWFVKNFLNAAFVEKNLTVLRYVPPGIILLFLLRGVGDYLSNYFPGWVSRQMTKTLRADLFAHYMRLPTAWYERESSGAMLSRLTYNIELVADAVTNSATIVIRDTITIVSLLVYLVWLNWRLAIFAMLAAPIIAGLVSSVNRRFRRYSTRIQNSMGDVTRLGKEAIDAQRVVKVFNAQEHMQAAFDTANELNRHSNMRLISARATSNPVVQLIAALGLASVLYVAIHQVNSGAMRVGDLLGFLTALLLVPEPLRRLVSISGPLQQSIAAGTGLFEVIDTPGESEGGTRQLERARGDVEFRGVEFTYDADKGRVLHNVNLRVAAGTTVAIVGRSGSGKSTLVSLLPRFYDPSSGEVLLDGVDVREYRLRDLRAQISLVSQDVVVFNDTIRNNIVFGAAGVDAAAVEAAAQAAFVSEFVATLPQGLDTQVGDRGMTLSGGQRQRIAIARALLRNTPILVLDEATSSLDTASERHIQSALDQLVKNRTTFVVAHRLSTIEHADLIVVMQDGAIIESGTHAELVAHSKVYAQLHQLSFNV